MGIEIALGAVGSFVSFGLATGVTAVVIGGAVIGAAIGGLTAAVTDGDIGKGMLFGAIGGAVTGGVASLAGGGGGAISGTASSIGGGTTTFAEVAGASAGGIWEAGGTTIGSSMLAEGGLVGTTQGLAGMGATGVLDSIGAQVGIGALTTGVKSYLAAGMSEDQTEAQLKANSENWEKHLESQKLAGEQAMEQLRYQRENLSEADKLTADLRTSELEQRRVEFAENLSLQRDQFDFQTEARANRQALFDERSRRGDGAVDTLATTGIYDYLQTKPTGSALTPPEEERQVA